MESGALQTVISTCTPLRSTMVGYDPIRDSANEASRTTSGKPYAPSYRVTEPKSVLIPISPEEVEEFKRNSQNELREGNTTPKPWPGNSLRRPREEINVENPSSAVASHYNKRREVGREAREFSPILPLKRFNNWVKSTLIALYSRPSETQGVGPRVLDMGCGKGGDLRKWDRLRPSMMVMIDIAEVSVEQARQRHEESSGNWPAEFFAFDCFQHSLRDVIPEKLLAPRFDTVTMQFCLHYGWDTETHARRMLENVATWLRTGGTFIGTIPDAETIYARLQASPDPASLQFGNDIYRIAFDEAAGPGEQPFGHRYRFFLQDAVDDVPEYVVDWPTLEWYVVLVAFLTQSGQSIGPPMHLQGPF